jgi:hypothetical protein
MTPEEVSEIICQLDQIRQGMPRTKINAQVEADPHNIMTRKIPRPDSE